MTGLLDPFPGNGVRHARFSESLHRVGIRSPAIPVAAVPRNLDHASSAVVMVEMLVSQVQRKNVKFRINH